MARIVVAGGGASGLAAAVCAAANGDSVTVIEHKDKVGKKILMTGNGRCNLTNMSGFEGKYHSSDHISDEKSLQLIYSTLERFGAKDTRSFFEGLGLYTKEKQGGCVYPVSEQASAVADALINGCKRLGVRIITDCELCRILPKKNGGGIAEAVSLVENNAVIRLSYDRLILAMGGKAAPSAGSDGSGYALAKSLGHSINTPLPALVQLRCEGKFFKQISGVRAQAAVALYVDGREVACDEGELQLTDYGISGIPVFQISRFAAKAIYEKKPCEARINFLPYVNDREGFIKKGIDMEHFGQMDAQELLSGMVHKKLATLICKRNCAIDKSVSEAGEGLVRKCVGDLFDFRVKVIGTNPFENAQVCSGGVPLSEVSSSFESKLCRGVYIVGELLDCDGLCGGYNLQWAWATGVIAGKGGQFIS